MASSKKLKRPLLLLTAVGSPRAAEALARALLQSRVCACVSLLPATRSLYWWKGRIRADRETLLLIKSVRGRLVALRDQVLRLHPYEVPELLVIDAETSSAYGKWLEAETLSREASM